MAATRAVMMAAAVMAAAMAAAMAVAERADDLATVATTVEREVASTSRSCTRKRHRATIQTRELSFLHQSTPTHRRKCRRRCSPPIDLHGEGGEGRTKLDDESHRYR